MDMIPRISGLSSELPLHSTSLAIVVATEGPASLRPSETRKSNFMVSEWRRSEARHLGAVAVGHNAPRFSPWRGLESPTSVKLSF
jgi:hypothetical protein